MGGFTPCHGGSPKNTITPEQVIRHYLKSTGTVRGDRHGPLRQHVFFFIEKQGFLQSRFFYNARHTVSIA